MDYRKQDNGTQTFWEHFGWYIPLLIIGIVMVAQVFFMNLNGKPWIYFYVASQSLLIIGAALIVFAKLPLYRSGRFLTFGVKYIPANLAGHYRWGWRLFLVGVVFSLCLLLSRV